MSRWGPPVRRRETLSLDEVCQLLAVTGTTVDAWGNQEDQERPRQVFCALLPVSRAEFLAAAQLGIQPAAVLAVPSEEYKEESAVVLRGQRLAVYKVYDRPDGLTELYCRREVGNVGPRGGVGSSPEPGIDGL